MTLFICAFVPINYVLDGFLFIDFTAIGFILADFALIGSIPNDFVVAPYERVSETKSSHRFLDH